MQNKRAAFYYEMSDVCDGFVRRLSRSVAGAYCACFGLKEPFLVFFFTGLRSCSFVTCIVQNLRVLLRPRSCTKLNPRHQRRTSRFDDTKTSLTSNRFRRSRWKHSVTSGDLSHSLLKGPRPARSGSSRPPRNTQKYYLQ